METFTRWQDPTIEDLKKEINKLTAESTEWEERTYCWQDRAENLQIVLDKIKEYIKENACYDKDIKQCCRDLLTDECDYILKLLEEIE